MGRAGVAIQRGDSRRSHGITTSTRCAARRFAVDAALVVDRVLIVAALRVVGVGLTGDFSISGSTSCMDSSTRDISIRAVSSDPVLAWFVLSPNNSLRSEAGRACLMGLEATMD